jgi:hypothetical protein
MPFRSYLAQCELPLTFGLGRATQADEVVIHWPDGATERRKGLAGNRLHTLEQAP